MCVFLSPKLVRGEEGGTFFFRLTLATRLACGGEMIMAIVGTCGRWKERAHTRGGNVVAPHVAPKGVIHGHNDSAYDTPPTCLLGCDRHATVTCVNGRRGLQPLSRQPSLPHRLLRSLARVRHLIQAKTRLHPGIWTRLGDGSGIRTGSGPSSDTNGDICSAGLGI